MPPLVQRTSCEWIDALCQRTKSRARIAGGRDVVHDEVAIITTMPCVALLGRTRANIRANDVGSVILDADTPAHEYGVRVFLFLLDAEEALRDD